MAGGRQLTVTLVANTKSFGRGMTDAFRSAEGFKGKMSALGSSLSMVAGPALFAAAAAASALAIKLGVDGVKAAAAEQKQLAILKQTLDNVGQGFAMDSISQFIDDLQFATGVSDDELRPALQSLVGVTKDASTAQQLLSASVDASVGSGKDLASVSAAVAKAVGGQTAALRKLIPGLDVTKIKVGDVDSVLAALEDRFGGSAKAAAQTYEGQLNRLGIAFSELQESFGKGFLSGLGSTADGTDKLTQSIRDLQPAFEALGTQIGEAVSALGTLSATAARLGNDLNIPRNEGLKNFAGYFTGLPGLLKTAAAAVGLFSDDAQKSLQKQAQAIDSARASETSLIEEGKRLTQETNASSDAFSRQYFTLDEVAAGAGRTSEEFALLREDIKLTTSSLGPLANAFDEANAAMERRQAMQDYRDALKAFIEEPSGQTRDAAVQAMEDVASSMKDPAEQGRFVSKAFDDISGAARDAGVGVPPDLAKIGAAAEQQVDPIARVKQLMEEIPRNIQTQIAMNVTVNGKYYDPYGAYNKATGGPVYATGGMVRAAMGTHASDNVPAMLSRGEYVLNADTVKRLGVGTLNRLNNGGAAGGGMVIEQLNVNAAPGERAEDSVPRALRRMAFVAGLNG